MGKPDLTQVRCGTQIVDMPAGPFTDPPMMSATGSHATRPEGAAHIEIPGCREIKQAQAPHPDPFEFGISQQQNIGSGQLGLRLDRPHGLA